MVECGIYRHFKGGMYRVLYCARHSETLESMVVYQALYDGSYWVRPESMWSQVVEHEGKQVARFTFISKE